jgi:hypothetical protein
MYRGQFRILDLRQFHGTRADERPSPFHLATVAADQMEQLR